MTITARRPGERRQPETRVRPERLLTSRCDVGVVAARLEARPVLGAMGFAQPRSAGLARPEEAQQTMVAVIHRPDAVKAVVGARLRHPPPNGWGSDSDSRLLRKPDARASRGHMRAPPSHDRSAGSRPQQIQGGVNRVRDRPDRERAGLPRSRGSPRSPRASGVGRRGHLAGARSSAGCGFGSYRVVASSDTPARGPTRSCVRRVAVSGALVEQSRRAGGRARDCKGRCGRN